MTINQAPHPDPVAPSISPATKGQLKYRIISRNIPCPSDPRNDHPKILLSPYLNEADVKDELDDQLYEYISPGWSFHDTLEEVVGGHFQFMITMRRERDGMVCEAKKLWTESISVEELKAKREQRKKVVDQMKSTAHQLRRMVQ